MNPNPGLYHILTVNIFQSKVEPEDTKWRIPHTCLKKNECKNSEASFL